MCLLKKIFFLWKKSYFLLQNIYFLVLENFFFFLLSKNLIALTFLLLRQILYASAKASTFADCQGKFWTMFETIIWILEIPTVVVYYCNSFKHLIAERFKSLTYTIIYQWQEVISNPFNSCLPWNTVLTVGWFYVKERHHFQFCHPSSQILIKFWSNVPNKKQKRANFFHLTLNGSWDIGF